MSFSPRWPDTGDGNSATSRKAPDVPINNVWDEPMRVRAVDDDGTLPVIGEVTGFAADDVVYVLWPNASEAQEMNLDEVTPVR